MSYQEVKNSRQRLKQRLIYIHGGKCCICGYNKCNSALEFHHKNPKEKSFSISSNTNVGFDKAVKESQKCILVCANCHREINEGLIDDSQYNSYSEERKKQKEKELELIKHKKKYFCKNCGKEITSYSNTGYCSICAAKNRRLVKNRPSREELKQLIRTLPFTTIAKKYNVSDNTIRKWCDNMNLPRKKIEISNYSNEEWEKI